MSVLLECILYGGVVGGKVAGSCKIPENVFLCQAKACKFGPKLTYLMGTTVHTFSYQKGPNINAGTQAMASAADGSPASGVTKFSRNTG